jgi:Bacterial regulatory protein, Fis family
MNLAEQPDDLRSFAARVASAHGTALFPSLAEFLAHQLAASEVQIGEPLDTHRARTLGLFAAGAIQPNYEFPIAGTACEALLALPQHDDAEDEETEDNTAGVFGTALRDAHGDSVGFLCAYFAGTPEISERQHHIVEIAAARLASELSLLRSERTRAELEAEVHRLRAELEALTRSEIVSAATGIHAAPVFPQTIDLEDTSATGLHHVQREHILRVLNATRWVIEGNSGAALKLGMKPATLRHRMKKLGIARSMAPGRVPA